MSGHEYHFPVPFHYGRGVFETLVVRGGRTRCLEWHVESMREAACALDLPADRIVPGEVPAGEGIWRWMLAPDGFRTTWQEGIAPLPDAVDLTLSRLRVSSASWEARFKTFSYLLMWQARAEAAGGWAVLLNEHGQVACAAMANLFWVSGGRVVTPAAHCGCRRGTTRRWVMEQGGLPVEEVEAGPEALDQAEEIFLTNARLGVFPVRSWAGRALACETGQWLRARWLESWNAPDPLGA
jgi:branched-chain amino acid aminotransferase/4-amino-4-deoxychorismate lyase